MAATKSSERRDGPRIDLRLRVRFEAGGHAGEAEASDVSPKGLRLESDKPIAKGTQLKLSVDAGEVEELQAVGEVTWCREHASPTGKMVYDVGVAFESDWLAKDRGPLGSALARIFAMNSYEPARNFERTPVSLRASSTAPRQELEIGNLSAGGMQVRSKGPLADSLRTGLGVKVEIELPTERRVLPGKVAWVAGQRPGEGPRVADSFGIEFDATLLPADREMLEQVRQGQLEPKGVVITLES
ncbi:MAG: PilZ domain-containing protein [Deltaproteobacteria bacterium]|nr:PilZ domain-containing protein [Deltaproteobacteria bacterium]